MASCAPQTDSVDLKGRAVLNYRLGMSVLSRGNVIREQLCFATGMCRFKNGNQWQCVLISARCSKQVSRSCKHG